MIQLEIIFNTELLICFIMQIFHVLKKANVTDGDEIFMLIIFTKIIRLYLQTYGIFNL